MNQLILATATRYLMPLLLLLSVFILLRGHNSPGGGFIGGLVASAAFALFAIASGVSAARRTLGVSPRQLIGGGLALAFASALVPMLLGEAFMTGIWADFELPVIGKLSTPLFFDIGVFLVVIGVMLTIILSLASEVQQIDLSAIDTDTGTDE